MTQDPYAELDEIVTRQLRWQDAEEWAALAFVFYVALTVIDVIATHFREKKDA